MCKVGKRKGIKNIAGVILVMLLMITVAGCGRENREANTGGMNSQQPVNEQEQDTAQEETNEPEKQDAPDTYQELLEGDTAPDFTADLVDGSTFTLSEQSGKVVLLNFWATWCGPCVGEMPAFEKLQKEYGDEVAVLAVNCLEDEETVRQFITENGYTFPIAFDVEGVVNMKYPTDGIPYTLVIGKDGTVQNIYLGAADADTQYQEYKSAIDSALGK